MFFTQSIWAGAMVQKKLGKNFSPQMFKIPTIKCFNKVLSHRRLKIHCTFQIYSCSNFWNPDVFLPLHCYVLIYVDLQHKILMKYIEIYCYWLKKLWKGSSSNNSTQHCILNQRKIIPACTCWRYEHLPCLIIISHNATEMLWKVIGGLLPSTLPPPGHIFLLHLLICPQEWEMGWRD